MFTKEQTKEAYKKLSDEVKDFIMDNETTELIESLLIEAGLSEPEREAADTEVFNTMLGLQDLSSAIKNISEITKKNPEELEKLEKDLEENIFNKLNITSNTNGANAVEKIASKNIGNSFEQIILNQAIAMQPAMPAEEVERDTSNEIRNTTENTIGNVPENLPTEEKREEGGQKNIHDYKSGQDPYREPIE